MLLILALIIKGLFIFFVCVGIKAWIDEEDRQRELNHPIRGSAAVAKRFDLLSEREQEDLASGQHPRLEDWVAGKIARGSLQFKPYRNGSGEYV